MYDDVVVVVVVVLAVEKSGRKVDFFDFCHMLLIIDLG